MRMPQRNSANLKSPEDELPAAIAGNREALSRVLLRHDSELRRHIRTRIPVEFRALIDEQDVVQITYLEAYMGIGRFKSDAPNTFRSWLRRIADNNLIDAVRTLRASKNPPPSARLTDSKTTDSNTGDLLVQFAASMSKSPSRMLSVKEAKEWVEKCMTELPPDYEAVLRLRIVERLDWRIVATIMNRSVAAVGMLAGRAHERLEELLGSQDPLPGR